MIDDKELFIGASIGIAIFPDDGSTGPELLANADLAMYRAKKASGSKACFFESGMDLQVRERCSLARGGRWLAAASTLSRGGRRYQEHNKNKRTQEPQISKNHGPNRRLLPDACPRRIHRPAA